MNLVKDYRLKAGLTQSQLAKLVGLSQNSICDIERGFYNPSLFHALKIYIALVCTPSGDLPCLSLDLLSFMSCFGYSLVDTWQSLNFNEIR